MLSVSKHGVGFFSNLLGLDLSQWVRPRRHPTSRFPEYVRVETSLRPGSRRTR